VQGDCDGPGFFWFALRDGGWICELEKCSATPLFDDPVGRFKVGFAAETTEVFQVMRFKEKRV